MSALEELLSNDWGFYLDSPDAAKPAKEHHRDVQTILANVRRAGVVSLRARLWACGYRPIAVRNMIPGVVNSGKAPLGEDWTERARRNPPAAMIEPLDPQAMNTGVLADGLRIFDVDVDQPELAHQVRVLASVHFGPTISRTRTTSPRFAFVYRAAEGEPAKRVIKSTDGRGQIEVLGHGQQLVAFGWHYSGAPLCWPDGSPDATPLDQLPTVTEGQVSGFLAEAAPLIGAEPPQAARATAAARPAEGIGTLDRYCEAALDSAVRAIIEAPDGAQELTLTRECFSIAGLVEGRGMPASLALRSLHWAAARMPNYKPHPWQPQELERKVTAAFAAGLRHPRPREDKRHG